MRMCLNGFKAIRCRRSLCDMSFGTRNACGVFDFQRENFTLRNNDYIIYYYQANIFRLNVDEWLHFSSVNPIHSNSVTRVQLYYT